jgi:hypothetical protein
MLRPSASARRPAKPCASGVHRWRIATLGALLAFLLYAARPLGDSLSVAAILPALLFARRGKGFLCGLFLGAAFVVRYPSAIFFCPSPSVFGESRASCSPSAAAPSR